MSTTWCSSLLEPHRPTMKLRPGSPGAGGVRAAALAALAKHLITLSGHLSLQTLDLLLALPDLHGEPGGHTLGCNLQVPLPLGLLLEVADPLLSVGTLLASQLSPCAELLYGPEQIVSLLP